jgi:hypothetical protein
VSRQICNSSIRVIAGLDPAIHPSSQKLFPKQMDARIKPTHDKLMMAVGGYVANLKCMTSPSATT